MLTIGYITARQSPRLDWFFQSLKRQLKPADDIQIVVVDFFSQVGDGWDASHVKARREQITHDFSRAALEGCVLLQVVPPKPTIWAGPHRITRQNWWHASCARNTAICYARGDWIAFLDDRCVLDPLWMRSIRGAMKRGYAACGAYEKVHDLVVKDGLIQTYKEPKDENGKPTGKDGRVGLPNAAVKAPGEWWFGCTTVLPMQWILSINGYDETCDGLSMEDVICGLMLQNNGYPLCYDQSMKIWEDRTPSEIGVAMRREDRGISPNDKSHAMLAMLRNLKRSMHPFDIADLRNDTLAGKLFPTPTGPTHDWYDGSPIKDF